MRPILFLVATGITIPLSAQTTGRTMQLVEPTVLGRVATFGLTHPASEAGNPYAFLWCMPPFGASQTLVVPGFTVQGLLRVAPSNTVGAFTGLLGATGSVTHSLSIPSHPSFLGMAWDLQSMDLAPSTATLSLADNALSLAVVEGPPASLNMVPIAPGTFLMGSPVTPFGVVPYINYQDAQPVHPVKISRAFWIGRNEVTQAQYQLLMGNNPSRFQGVSYPNAAQRPVDSVTWGNAVAYCAALTAQEQAAGRLPTGYVYRLPTEAEWEYCYRAGTTTEFYVGQALFCGQANFSYSHHTATQCPPPGNFQTSTVGFYGANPWGLHDMAGNVWEWCLDSWDLSANYPNAQVTDPYVTTGSRRILRGGSFYNPSSQCRAAWRAGISPTSGDYGVGFRVVCAPVR